MNLENLPDSIGSLKYLDFLKIPDNNLTHLPNTMKNLKNLRTLDISWNNSLLIPDWIESLPNLLELNIAGISQNNLPDQLFRKKLLLSLMVDGKQLLQNLAWFNSSRKIEYIEVIGNRTAKVMNTISKLRERGIPIA